MNFSIRSQYPCFKSGFLKSRSQRWLLSVTALATLGLSAGCQREWYREKADEQASALIEEKAAGRSSIRTSDLEMDPRSRYYNPDSSVRPPMPPDDPASHEFMHMVDGKAQWAHWHDNGDATQLENPGWRIELAKHAVSDEQGNLVVQLNDAVRIALLSSPNYQSQIETLYLSALDVSTERFRFDVQYFGGAGTGSGGRTFGNSTSSTITGSRFDNNGLPRTGQSGFGVTSGTNLQLQRNLATAGQMVVGFANSLVWQFDGHNTNFASSLINFSFIQPLLRAGGRNIALEQLTIAERALLANVRAFEHFRQGFYTQIAIGENGTTAPRRRGGFSGSSGLSGFTGQGSGGFGGVGDATGFGQGGGGGGAGGGGGGSLTSGFAGGGAGNVGGFIGLLQQRQQIRNAENTLRAQQQTLHLLEAHLDAGLIDIAQVDQFRQSIETQRANLLQVRNAYQDTLDTFKITALGIAPDVELDVADDLIKPFRFLDPGIEQIQSSISSVIEDFGMLPEKAEPSAVEPILARLMSMNPMFQEQMDLASRDIDSVESLRESRQHDMSASEKKQFDDDIARLRENLQSVRSQFETQIARVEELQKALTAETVDDTMKQIIGINVELTNLASELSLTQTRARIETVTVERISLDSKIGLEIARANRLDWMNNRAALVDTWRLIEFNGNRLESNLDIFMNGSMGTIGDNAVRFRGEDTSLQWGVRFDAPLNRLVERNDFRQQLILYQQARRSMIQFEDGINARVRIQLRDLEQLRVNLEIQRRAVAIAIRRVDQTRENLNRPQPPAAPGAGPSQFGPTAALNLLTALNDLRASQDNFMSVWLNYYSNRMRLMRELGLLRLNEENIWLQESVDDAVRATAEENPLPPAVPQQWLESLNIKPESRNTMASAESGDGDVPADKDDTGSNPSEPVEVPGPAKRQAQHFVPQGSDLKPAAVKPADNAAPVRVPLPAPAKATGSLSRPAASTSTASTKDEPPRLTEPQLLPAELVNSTSSSKASPPQPAKAPAPAAPRLARAPLPSATHASASGPLSKAVELSSGQTSKGTASTKPPAGSAPPVPHKVTAPKKSSGWRATSSKP